MRPAGAGRPGSPGRESLLQALGPVVESAGYVLEDVTVTAAGRRSLVRVSVDTDAPGVGIDLDGVATVSRAVSEHLDRDGDQFGGPYVLEVSSPGVDRPLTEQRHWRRALGRVVRVPVDGQDVIGRVRAVTGSGVLLVPDVPGVPDGAVAASAAPGEIGWDRLGRGQVQVEFTRPDRDASGSEAQEDPA